MYHIKYCFRYKDGALLAQGIDKYYKIYTEDVFNCNILVYDSINQYIPPFIKARLSNGELEIMMIKYEWSFKKYHNVLE